MAGLFLVVESWLNDKADAGTRGRTFGAYLLVSSGGSAGEPTTAAFSGAFSATGALSDVSSVMQEFLRLDE
jgi:hypothetical protein